MSKPISAKGKKIILNAIDNDTITDKSLQTIKNKYKNTNLPTLIDNKIAKRQRQRQMPSNLSESEEKYGQKEKNTFDHILSIVNELSIPDIQSIINNNKLNQSQITYLKSIIKQKYIKEAQMLTSAINAIEEEEKKASQEVHNPQVALNRQFAEKLAEEEKKAIQEVHNPQVALNRQFAEKLAEEEKKANQEKKATQEQKARQQTKSLFNKTSMNINKQFKKNLNNTSKQQVQEDRLDKFGMIASIVSIIFFIVTFIPAFFRKDLGYTDSDINTIAPILISIYVVFLIMLFAIYKYG